MNKTGLLLLLCAAMMCVQAGCTTGDEAGISGESNIARDIEETSRQVGQSVADAGQSGVETIDNAGEKSGVKNVVKGVGQVVVDTTEDIGRPQRGEVMGNELTLFPPETENEGKVLKIEF
ncbi:MAG: hypothetical protein AB1454_03335 [Candidatus Auribacterota bacterium]